MCNANQTQYLCCWSEVVLLIWISSNEGRQGVEVSRLEVKEGGGRKNGGWWGGGDGGVYQQFSGWELAARQSSAAWSEIRAGFVSCSYGVRVSGHVIIKGKEPLKQ